MRKRSLLAVVISILMIVTMMPGMAFADDTVAAPTAAFVDMPDDWSTDALQNAVDNGLLKGYEGVGGTMIKPAGTLTRAEMATVVNRAFGAADKASLSGVNDVPSDAWYAPEMAKAVQMGTMKSDTQMRPNACITRQEACTILARAFKLEAANTSALNSFADSESVASFAKDSMGALVSAGYVSGSNGKLNPLANITRAEFAKIMDNMVKQYVTTAGTVTTVPATGNVMVNTPEVILDGVTVNGSLIIGDGVGNGNVTLNNVKVTGDTIVRGGGVNSFIVKGNSVLGTIKVAKVDGNVRIAVEGNASVSVVYIADGKDDVVVEGKVATLEVAAADVPVVVQNAQIETVNVTAAEADLTVAKTATVTTVNVDKAAAGAAVAVAGTVTTLKTEAKAELAVTGTVAKVDVASTAAGTDVKIDKAAKVETLNTAANVTTSGEGKAASVTGNGTVNAKASEATTPSGGGGGGSSSGGGSTTTPVSGITKANLADRAISSDPTADTNLALCDNYALAVTKNSARDYVDLTFTGSNLALHRNGQNAEGFWVGATFAAPEGATKMKCAFAPNQGDLSLGDLIEDTSPTFYCNLGDETPKTWVQLQWFNAEEEEIGAATTYKMDVSAITSFNIDSSKTLTQNTVIPMGATLTIPEEL